MRRTVRSGGQRRTREALITAVGVLSIPFWWILQMRQGTPFGVALIGGALAVLALIFAPRWWRRMKRDRVP